MRIQNADYISTSLAIAVFDNPNIRMKVRKCVRLKGKRPVILCGTTIVVVVPVWPSIPRCASSGTVSTTRISKIPSFPLSVTCPSGGLPVTGTVLLAPHTRLACNFATTRVLSLPLTPLLLNSRLVRQLQPRLLASSLLFTEQPSARGGSSLHCPSARCCVGCAVPRIALPSLCRCPCAHLPC